MKLTDRPYRLRTDGTRSLVSETTLDTTDLVTSIFVDATTDERVPIKSILGHERVPVVGVVDRVVKVCEAGVKVAIVLGIPESKDPEGSRAYVRSGVVQEAVRVTITETDAYAITDVRLCEYTDYGHCGVLEDHAEDNPTLTVENGPTLDLLVETVVSHAEADTDIVAPLISMDGMVGAIRTALDGAGHDGIPIMPHVVRYEGVFYGPFCDAADGMPVFGDRWHYQMDLANAQEALHEVAPDVEQGVDVLMVKPGLPYLDTVRAVREGYDHPVTVYNVSGEYAILHAAAEKGWLDLDGVVHESFLSMKRADVDLIITYFVECVAWQPD